MCRRGTEVIPEHVQKREVETDMEESTEEQSAEHTTEDIVNSASRPVPTQPADLADENEASFFPKLG